MSYYFEFDRDAELLKITFDGELNNRTLMEAVRTVREVSSRLKPKRSVTDFTQVSAIHLDPAELYSLTHLRPTFEEDVVRVIVAPTDVLFGMARMFQMAGSDSRPNLHVARSLAAAYRTLGITKPPSFERLAVA